MIQNSSAKQISYAALLSALVFVGTQFLKIPLVFGYFNMGDCFILLSGWLIGGPYAMAGAAAGAGLADILSGYVAYAPVTLIIKALMVLIAHTSCRLVCNNSRKIKMCTYAASAFAAELLMVVGYYLFEGCLYGFSAAVVTIPGNLIQGATAIVVSLLLMGALARGGLIRKIRDSFSKE